MTGGNQDYSLTKTSLDQCDILQVNDGQQLGRAAEALTTASAPLLEVANLDNHKADVADMSEGENNDMSKRMRHRVDINGKPQWISGKTQQELCEDYMKKSIVPIEADNEEKQETPFAAYANKWFEVFHLPNVSEGTAKNTRSILTGHLIPYFGNRDIASITVSDVQSFFNTKRKLSKSMCDKMFIYLNQIFKRAKKDKIISENPCDDDDISYSKKKTERQALETDQAYNVEKHIEDIRGIDRLEVAFALHLGLRREEFLGLRWEDVNFQKSEIRVERAILFTGKTGNQPIIGNTKNDEARIMPLLPVLEPLLKPFAKRTGFIFEGEKSKPTYAEDYKGTRFNDDSKPKTERMFRNDWTRIKKQIDLYGATPHVLRHTFCKAALEAGVDPKTVQGLMGHKTSAMTMDTYAEIDKKRVAKAGGMLDGMYGRVAAEIDSGKRQKSHIA